MYIELRLYIKFCVYATLLITHNIILFQNDKANDTISYII